MKPSDYLGLMSKRRVNYMRVVKLMIGTNGNVAERMLKGNFNTLVWASDDMETVAHYYEGAVVEITVKLLDSKKRQYLRNGVKLNTYKNGYGWGEIPVKYPPNATWYSFSGEYLKKYLVGIREIHPDLTQWQDDK